MTIEERLKALNDAYINALSSGVVENKKTFADYISVNPSILSQAFKGNETYLTDGFIDRLMLATAGIKTEETRTATLPVIPVDAVAGTLGEFASSVADYDCERMVSPIKGADFAIKVCGESMSPEYPNGSMILIKKVNEKAFIEWGKVYVLDTANGTILKQVRNTAQEGIIECVSLNPTFQPFTVDTAFINGWYRVLACISLK